tara:strand:- start:46 stop:609 length:564 start_codon:yes stop_codon:yes gene_type:complete
MRIEYWIFLVTGFLIYDTYHDGTYSQYLLSGKKYYKMLMYAFVGISLWTFMKKHPNESRGLMARASDIIKYVPIDSEAKDLLTPIFDFTNTRDQINSMMPQGTSGAMNRMMTSGTKTTQKRVVSETKKKYVASQQDWKCKNCSQQLSYTYEIDHRISLENGGSNHVTNLDALCVGCHKEKTLEKNLF